MRLLLAAGMVALIAGCSAKPEPGSSSPQTDTPTTESSHPSAEAPPVIEPAAPALPEARSLDEAIAIHSAKSGAFLASSPKIRADGHMYVLHGQISMANGESEFIASNSPSQEGLQQQSGANVIAALVGHGKIFDTESTDYFYVIIPDGLKQYYLDNARVSGRFDLVGRYSANADYETVAGATRPAPVFEAVYFDLWENRRGAQAATKEPETPSGPVGSSAFKAAQSEYDACIEQSGGNFPSMIECSQEDARAQDDRLNAAYKLAMTRAEDKEALRLRQRDWIKERDEECAIESDSGQVGELNHIECIREKTAARADALEAMR
jgi:uncharacterized protein YecT (DUF1311 family)